MTRRSPAERSSSSRRNRDNKKTKNIETTSGRYRRVPKDISVGKGLKPKYYRDDNEIEEQLRKQRAKAVEPTSLAPPPAIIGEFVYDPVRKGYFPIKQHRSFEESDTQPSTICPDFNRSSSRIQPSSFFLSSPSNLLSLLNSAEICNSSKMRHIFYDTIRGLAIVNDSRIIPTTNFKMERDFITNTAKNCSMRMHKRWLTILAPVRFDQNRNRSTYLSGATPTIPFDCLCKVNLHPSSSTFDVLQQSSTGNKLPAIVSIIPGGHLYRPPTCPKVYNWHSPLHRTSSVNHTPAPFVLEKNNDVSSSWEPHSVRLASSQYSPSGHRGYKNLVGAVYYDPNHSNSIFKQYFVDSEQEELSTTSVSNIIDGEINNFAFSNQNSPETVAFAFNQKRFECKNIEAIDLVSGLSFQLLSRQGLSVLSQKSTSDTLCVEFLNTSTTVYGHRNGSISTIDHRSGSVSYITKEQPSGSIMSLISDQQSNRTAISPHQIIAKGSFGRNYIFDVRKCGGGSNYLAKRYKPSSLLHILSVPEENNVAAHPVKSSNCSGLALDPTGSIIVSPFIDRTANLRLGVWTTNTGKLVKSLLVNNPNSVSSPLYCELSPHSTSACKFEPNFIDCNEDKGGDCSFCLPTGAWGLWFKCGELIDGSPEESSGIHHILFEG